MRSDRQTVNGVTAYKLLTALSGTGKSTSKSDVTDSSTSGWIMGIRVYVLHSGGTKTELTAGTPVAQANINPGVSPGASGGSWNCPQTTLATTDAILIEVWGICNGVGWGPYSWQLFATFVTEQLNTTSLNAATWSVTYYGYVRNTWSKSLGAYTTVCYFYWDGSYPSRIDNFSWGVVAAGAPHFIGDGLAGAVIIV